MTRLARVLLFLVAACGPPPRGALAARNLPVTAQQPVVTSLRLQPGTVTLARQAQLQFRILVKWNDGATIVPALRWTVEGGEVSARGLYTAASVPGTYRVIVTLDSGLLADTAVVIVPAGAGSPPPGPLPATTPSVKASPSSPRPRSSGGWKEPAGFSKLTHRDFSSKARNDDDRGPNGSQGWDGAEYRYSNIIIAQDPGAPLSPPSIVRQLYPPRTVAPNTTYSPGVMQMLTMPKGTRKLYFRTAFRVSANWQGHPTSTNKMFFVRSQAGHEPIVRLRGAGGGPLQLNVDLQGSRRDKRNREPLPPLNQQSLVPNQGVAEANSIQRGKWYVLEGLMEIGTNGQANGRLRLWLDGTLTHEYTDIEYEATAARSDWGYLHIASTWGGGQGTIHQPMWMDFDDFYVSGAP